MPLILKVFVSPIQSILDAGTDDLFSEALLNTKTIEALRMLASDRIIASCGWNQENELYYITLLRILERLLNCKCFFISLFLALCV